VAGPLPRRAVVAVTLFDLAIAETWTGETVAFVLPRIPDDAPEEIREGVARRRITAIDGKCPCGGELVLPNRAARRKAVRTGTPVHMRIEHEDDCPAIDTALDAAIRRWKR
jgi:hypothetical protein